MARKRMIDPSIWADESFGSLSRDAQLLYIGIISNADDEGRLPANPLFLTSTILPYAGLSADKAEKIRNEIVTKMKSIILYEIEGKEYFQLHKWKFYQVINKPSASKYPPLPEDYGSTTVVLRANRIEKNRIEKNRREEASLTYLKSLPKEDVEEFLGLYELTELQLQDKALSLVDYCQSKGKTYRNYKALLQNALRRDFKKRPEKSNAPSIYEMVKKAGGETT